MELKPAATFLHSASSSPFLPLSYVQLNLQNFTMVNSRNISYISQSEWVLRSAQFMGVHFIAANKSLLSAAMTVLTSRAVLENEATFKMNCSLLTTNLTFLNSSSIPQDILNQNLSSKCLTENSTEATNSIYQHQWSLVFTPLVAIIIAFIVILCSILTFGGNLLVFIAFFIEKKLQITNNYFLLSLAVADGCVGLISVNFWLLLYLGNAYWPFGWAACVTWIFFDYVCCTTSIYHVFIISIDRYWSVSAPATYRTKMNARMAFLMIIPTWLVSFIWWMALIVGHPLVVGNLVIDGMCYANYWGIGVWTYLSTSITYWIPVIVITTLYIHIYRIAKRLKKKRKLKSEMIRRQLVSAAKATSAMQKLRQSQKSSDEEGGEAPDIPKSNFESKPCTNLEIKSVEVEINPENSLVKLSHQIANGVNHDNLCKSSLSAKDLPSVTFVKNKTSSTSRDSVNPDSCMSPELCMDDSIIMSPEILPKAKTVRLKNSANASGFAVSIGESHSNSRGEKTSSASLKKMESVIRLMKTPPAVRRLVKRQSNDKKAMRTLTFLLGAFILCWTPWNIAEVVNGIWGPDTVNPHLYQFTWFLTYFNSALNPICYAFANTLFKDTFIRILTCGKMKPVAGSAGTPSLAAAKNRANRI